MMNKLKTSKAWRWKAAAFLPMLALLLMAFGRTGENVPIKENASVKVITPPEIIQENQTQKSSRLIEIRKDGYYIDNKLCSLEEVVTKGKEWGKASNDWIHLRIDQSIPYNRIDDIKEQLSPGMYHITQSTVNSDDIVYFSGDVSQSARFTQSTWDNWMKSQLNNFPEGKSKGMEYKIKYSFIIDKSGKVREGHIVKGSEYPEINAAYEKILTQMPDWEPAKRLGKPVSVYFHSGSARMIYKPPHTVATPPPIFIDIKKEGIFLMKKLVTLDEFRKQLPLVVKNNPQSEVRVNFNNQNDSNTQAVKDFLKEQGVSYVRQTIKFTPPKIKPSEKKI